jgi:hypothetical protein
MTTRTLTKTVTFRRPFSIGGFDELLPAGDYCVETDEELLVGLSFSSYRRVLTVIHLPAASGNPNLTRSLTIDPNELDAALIRDQAHAETHTDTELEEIMLDPIAHLVMNSDGLSKAAVWRVIDTVRERLAVRSDQPAMQPDKAPAEVGPLLN